MCRRFVRNLYIHRNGPASGRKERPGDQLNTRFLHSIVGIFAYQKIARPNWDANA